MLETCGEKLKNIEIEIDQQDYSKAILECGKLVEYIISDTFCKFHTFLATPEDRRKFCEFEQGQWEQYSNFIQRPTTGVSLRFYPSLVKDPFFPIILACMLDLTGSLGRVSHKRNAR